MKESRVKDHYNRVAAQLDLWHKKNYFYHNEILRYYRFLIPPESRILELGCGAGDLIGNLSPSYGVGVDISDQMVEVAKKRYPQIRFHCQDAEEFLADETFDYIIISGT